MFLLLQQNKSLTEERADAFSGNDTSVSDDARQLAAMAQAQQQPQEPDPAFIIAQAEMGKAQAEQLRAQVEAQKVQNETMRIQIEAQKMQNTSLVNQAKSQVDIFNAQTSRLKVEVDAEKAGAEIDNTDVKTFGEEIKNQREIQR